MSDYITNTAELTAIADAIRAKGGTTASLVYPDGFVSAIEDISSGGGGTSLETVSVTIDMSALVGGGFGFLITGTQLDGGGLTYSVNQVDDSQETITFDAVVGTNVTIESFSDSPTGWHWYSDEGKIEDTYVTTESCQIVCVRGADTIHLEI